MADILLNPPPIERYAYLKTIIPNFLIDSGNSYIHFTPNWKLATRSSSREYSLAEIVIIDEAIIYTVVGFVAPIVSTLLKVFEAFNVDIQG